LKNIINSSSSSPAFNVLMFSTFWALQIFFAKLGFNGGALVLPFQLLINIIAFIILAVLIFPRVNSQLQQLFKNQKSLFWKLYTANGIQAGLGTSLAMVGIAMTDAVNAGFLVKFTVVTTIFFAWIMLKEKITTLKIVTVILMLIGVYLLTTRGQSLIPRPGDIFLIAACVCWSLGSVLIRRFLRDKPLDPDVVTMQKPLASIPILVVLAGIALAVNPMNRIAGGIFSCCRVTSADLIYGLLTGFSLAMAWIFVYRTLKVSTASYLTLMSMLTPVIVTVLAIVFLGESLVLVQAIGAGLIILSGIVIYFSDMAYV
jgi:drug/metabolite transporter (DMT)-like permease